MPRPPGRQRPIQPPSVEVVDRCLPKLILSNLPTELPACSVELRLRHHGHKVIQYVQALHWLAEAGFDEAQQALSQLRSGKSSKLQQNAPVDLDKIARWSLDPFALVSLQLLLFLNCARLNPTAYGWVGAVVGNMSDFNEDTCPLWWRYANDLFYRVCPHPEALRSLSPLMTAPSLVTRTKKRKFFLLRLKQRFTAFAPPPAKYRTGRM